MSNWIKKLFGQAPAAADPKPDPIASELLAIEAEDLALASEVENLRQRRRDLKQRADALRARRN
jgi:hypothetical protein